MREPWRMALAYLYRAYGHSARTLDHPVVRHLSAAEHDIFVTMLERGINAPLTSSCGRLFDAVAALLNIRHSVSYDGQAAIELEALAETADMGKSLPFNVTAAPGSPWELDFSPLLPALLSALQSGTAPATLALRFHVTVAEAATDVCVRIARDSGQRRIVLSGGVFQNRLLSEMIYTGLTKQGLDVYTHRLTPPNDGCIALGQAAITGWQTRRNN